jgi:Zn-finger nucleic acid-binding protein
MTGIGIPMARASDPFTASLFRVRDRIAREGRRVPGPARLSARGAADWRGPTCVFGTASHLPAENPRKDDPMRCPVDNETLVMADRNGVEIDYCPKCRGVWLDRGELDKIIERTGGGPAPTRPAPQGEPVALRRPEPPPEPRREEYRRDDDYRRRDDDDDDYRHGRRKKRDSFLSDLFDF